MKPVTIKYYGLFSITKKTYVILQIVVFVVALVLIVYCLTLPESPRLGFDLNNPRRPRSSRWILSHLLELVLLATFLEVLDAIFTLRAFARKEKELAGQRPGKSS
jgi:hypothetical protein